MQETCAGENSILIVGGANQVGWELQSVDKDVRHIVIALMMHFRSLVLQLIRTAGAILLQREIPDRVNRMVAEVKNCACDVCFRMMHSQIASAAGVPVILDAGGVDTPLPRDILPHLSILSPNESELSRITGLPVISEADAEQAAQQLVKLGVDQVLVKLGSKGSLLVTGREGIPAFLPDG